ncbi:MAG: hypothetical protein ABJO67_17640 [Pseudoruegeria sp.]
MASLGRADKLQDSGELKRLAESAAEMAGIDTPSKPPLCPQPSLVPSGLFRDMLLRALLRCHNQDDAFQKLVATDLSEQDLRRITLATMFPRHSPLAPHHLDLISAMAPQSAKIQRLIQKDSSSDPELFVHIEKSCPPNAPPSLLRGTITATACNAQGRVLMYAHWPEHLPLPDMIERHVGNMLRCLGKQKLILLVGQSIRNKRLLDMLHKANVQFLTPMREPHSRLAFQADTAVEAQAQTVPIQIDQGLRCIKITDHRIAMHDRQAREVQLSRLEQGPTQSPRQSRALADMRAQLEAMADWDGCVLLTTNIKAPPDDFAKMYHIHIQAQKALEQVNQLATDLNMNPDLPRNIKPLVYGCYGLNLIALSFQHQLCAIVSKALEKPITWPRLIRAIDEERPIMLRSGPEKMEIKLQQNTPIMDALLGGTQIQLKEFLAKAAAPLPQTHL